jgi:hypothetical protein
MSSVESATMVVVVQAVAAEEVLVQQVHTKADLEEVEANVRAFLAIQFIHFASLLATSVEVWHCLH